MKCPYCGNLDDRVIDSRASADGVSIRRRRECYRCGKRFTTYERIEQVNLKVIKKDGAREDFSHQKVLAGLMKACQKRNIKMAVLEKIVEEVEAIVLESDEKEVSTKIIGEHIMRRLKEIDEVAYIRFASVYRSFKDAGQFISTVKSLKGSSQH